MKSLLLLLLLLLVSLASNSHALRCHTCVASNEDECNLQGSASCPQYADACSTITGPNTVMKSCSYKAFCDTAKGSTSGAQMSCCFGDDCNGPPRLSHSYNWDYHSYNGAAGGPAASPALLVAAMMLLHAISRHL